MSSFHIYSDIRDPNELPFNITDMRIIGDYWDLYRDPVLQIKAKHYWPGLDRLFDPISDFVNIFVQLDEFHQGKNSKFTLYYKNHIGEMDYLFLECTGKRFNYILQFNDAYDPKTLDVVGMYVVLYTRNDQLKQDFTTAVKEIRESL